MQLALFSGMRPGEILALQWKQKRPAGAERSVAAGQSDKSIPKIKPIEVDFPTEAVASWSINSRPVNNLLNYLTIIFNLDLIKGVDYTVT